MAHRRRHVSLWEKIKTFIVLTFVLSVGAAIGIGVGVYNYDTFRECISSNLERCLPSR